MATAKAKSKDQRSFWRSCKAEVAEETVSAAHCFPGTPQNDSVWNVPRVHLGNVGSEVGLFFSRRIRDFAPPAYPPLPRTDAKKGRAWRPLENRWCL